MTAYTLKRSNRKTAAIHITESAVVEVRAPLKMPQSEIDRFVASKETWIASHLAMRAQMNAEKAVFSLTYGNTVMLCGKRYPIHAKDGGRAGFDGAVFFLPPGLPPESVKSAIVKTYKELAKNWISTRIAAYASQMGVSPTAVRITSAKTRWGSCSVKRSINFSWRLMMADEDVIDYVVVHELAHIRELNHSPRFWAVVEGVLPDYRRRRDALRALQDTLSREDWETP